MKLKRVGVWSAARVLAMAGLFSGALIGLGHAWWYSLFEAWTRLAPPSSQEAVMARHWELLGWGVVGGAGLGALGGYVYGLVGSLAFNLVLRVTNGLELEFEPDSLEVPVAPRERGSPQPGRQNN